MKNREESYQSIKAGSTKSASMFSLRPEAEYSQGQCIHQLFEAQVERTPQAIALLWEQRQVSYQKLNERANQLAHLLLDLGVGPEILVGVCLERSPEMVVALLAVLKAGGAYLPLDPSYPAERLAFMVEDSEVAVLLTQARLRPQWAGVAPRLVCLEREEERISRQSVANVESGVKPENIAYVIYTSGSTGRPKGVLVRHRGFVNHCTFFKQCCGLQVGDRVLQFTSISFDIAAEEIFPTFLSGATLLLRPEEALDFLYFSRFLENEQVTVLDLPTAYWHLWVTQLSVGATFIPSSLRLVVVGGEQASPKQFNLWKKHARADIRWVNTYGPTETTITSTIYEPGFSAEDSGPHDPQTIPIGLPIANVQCYALDPHLQPVPSGVPGELFIGGVGVARGYLKRPEQTAERFVPHPWSAEPAERLYRTGDLVRVLPDGNLDFLGRLDHQVKIRGFRVELGEIEAVLAQHPSVREAKVVAHAKEATEKRLVAYLVTADTIAPSARELRQYLWERLPDYMLPSAFVVLEALPLTPNGKIDYHALVAFDTREHEIETEYSAPRTPLEEAVAEIWAEVLERRRISIYDTFLELGGDSLLATQIVSRLRERFHVDVPLRLFLGAATVAGLAERVEELTQRGCTDLADPIQPVPHREVLPLSLAQQRLWLLEQLVPGTAAYVIPLALQLSGPLHLPALERSLHEIVSRHESLRTRFPRVDGQPTQEIVPPSPFPLEHIDLQGLAEAERSREAQRLINQEGQRPFDLVQGPLVRAHLVPLAEHEHILLVCLHHLVSDGWSLEVLVRELAVLYDAHLHDLPSPLPALPIQYADFAAWQRQWLKTGILTNQLAYWKHQLAGAPALLQLPTDHPRPTVQTFNGAAVPLHFSEALTYRLKALSQQQETTLFMTLLAAFQVLLCRYSRQEDIVVGTPLAGRVRREVEALIGFFVNTLVLRTDLSGNPSFCELLKRVREVALDAYAHQDVPFEQLVEEMRPQRDPSHTPLFQVLFVFQNVPKAVMEFLGMRVRELNVERTTAQFDLTLDLTETPDGLEGWLEYNTDLFEAATIARMAQHLQTLLSSIADDPQQPIGALSLLTEPERQHLLVEWNATQTDYLHDHCIHQLFEEQVERTPHATALILGNHHVTYSELNERANQLAHLLLDLGVGPEILVGVCLERSPEMVVALLAVLKAGGAYLPLDPSYPAERLAFMLQDSQAVVLLTQERLRSQLPLYSAKLVCLDTEWEHMSGQSRANVLSGVQPSNLAYSIYTSGSTGHPKGVLVEHRGLCNVAQAQAQTFQIEPTDRILQFASLNFDAATFEIIMALSAGAALVLGTSDSLLPGPSLSRLLREQAVTVALMTPSTLTMLPSAELSALRVVISAGERCSSGIVAQWAPRRQFFNAYGPTETTIWASVFANGLERNGSIIGQPIANTQLYVLDPHLQPVPSGVPGELFIGGVGVARGYLNRPELTAERFLPDPFSPHPHARLYRTGDLVRVLPDGNLDFLGRLDHQVKIRGFRVELGEIEAVLAQHPSVQQCLVHLHEGSQDEKAIVAYIIPRQSLTLEELRHFLKQQLPGFMIPSAFVMIEAFPYMPNGKIDYHALPLPKQNRSATGAPFEKPRTRIEYQLRAIWQEVLNLDLAELNDIGVKDNFFDLGGNSLQAARLMAQIQSLFDRELSLATLFQNGTIEQQALLLSKQIETEPWSPLVKIQPSGTKKPLFLAHPVNGGCFNYVTLARCMEKDFPLYGFQARGLEHHEEPITSVKEMAQQYIQALRAFQPEGPYLLGGWSGGGYIAFEMAQQLQHQQQEVALLALIDTIHDNTEDAEALDDAAILMERYGPYLPLSLEVLRSLNSEEQMNYVLEEMKRDSAKNNKWQGYDRRFLNLQKVNTRAFTQYKPEVYNGRITLFRAKETLEKYPEQLELGWWGLATEGIEIIEVPGDHLSVVRLPHVAVLAEKLMASIIEATQIS